MAKKIPQAHLDAMVKAYINEGVAAHVAGARFGYSKRPCLAELKRRKIPLRRNFEYSSKGHRSTKDRELALSLYNQGLSSPQIKAATGIATSTILGIIKRGGLQSRQPKDYRKYSLNESYFEKIDAPEKAYWLGFIAADGNVNKRLTSLTINLAACDRGHLEQFATALNFNGPIASCTNGMGHPGVRLEVHSTKLAADLVRLGITPAKSLTLQAWRGHNGPLGHHYWRGVWAGDGTIGIWKKSGGWTVWNMGCVGSKSMMQSFAEFAGRAVGGQVNVRLNRTNKPSGIWSFAVSGAAKPQRLAAALVKDATITLERKRILAEQLINTDFPPSSYAAKAEVSTEQLIAEYNTGKSTNWLGKKYGMDAMSIRKRLKRAGIEIRGLQAASDIRYRRAV